MTDVAIVRVTLVPQPLPLAVACMTGSSRLLFIGTTDGRIAAYETPDAPSPRGGSGSSNGGGPQMPPALQLLHSYTTAHQQPIRSLIPVPSKGLLIAATADAISLHGISMTAGVVGAVGQHQPLSEVCAAVTGLRDCIACSARLHKGALTLAVLFRRKVRVFDVSATAGLALAMESAALPDGGQCLAWTAKGVLVGFNKEYAFLPVVATRSGAAAAAVPLMGVPAVPLYAVGRTGAPFLLPLCPSPEVLVGTGAGLCLAAADGSLVADPREGSGGSGGGVVSLSSIGSGGGGGAPAQQLALYIHPYLLFAAGQRRGEASSGSGAPASSLDVHMPLSGAAESHCQSLRVAIRCLTASSLADLDGSDDAAAYHRDAVVACLDDANRVHLLTVAPVAEQLRAFAAAGRYDLGRRARELSSTEVTGPVAALAAVMGAASDIQKGNYAAAFQSLMAAGTHPMLAVRLHGDLIVTPSIAAAYAPAPELTPLLASCVAAVAEEPARAAALAALLNYLLAQRIQTRGGNGHGNGGNGPGAHMLLRGIDTALLETATLLGREETAMDVLRDTNWCHLEECAAFLTGRSQWVALAALYRCNGRHEMALGTLATLAANGASASSGGDAVATSSYPPLPAEVQRALTELAASGYTVAEELTLQSAVTARLQSLNTPSAAAMTGPSDPHRTQAIAVLTMLSYLRGLSLVEPTQRSLFERRCPWLLANVPPTRLSLSVFLSAANKRHYRDALAMVQAAIQCSSGSGSVLGLAVMADFQAVALSDPLMAGVHAPLSRRGPSCLEMVTAAHAAPLVSVSVNADTDATSASAAAATADLHAAHWQNLALLVLGGQPGDPTPLPERRRQLSAFLSRSPFIDLAAAAEFFEDGEVRPHSTTERSIVYRLQGSHQKALDMLLDEGGGSVAAARAYCAAVKRETGDEAPFLLLFRHLFRQGRGDGDDDNGGTNHHQQQQQQQEALDLLTRSSSNNLDGDSADGGGDGLSALAALPMLPDDLPVREVRALLMSSLRRSGAEGRRSLAMAAVLAAREQGLACQLASERSRGIATAADGQGHACAVCCRKLLSDTTFLCFPNGVVAHVGCVDERGVCPVTGVRFCNGLLPALTKG